MTTGEAQSWGIETLSKTPKPFTSATPLLDTTLILSCLLGVSRSYLIAHPEIGLGDKETLFRNKIEQRTKGIPIAYITGTKEFWGLPFHVTPAVLIPKPDTEILVEQALPCIRQKELQRRGEQGENRQPLTVADICTGSGCIAVTLAYYCPGILIAASDISDEALAIASENVRTLLPPAQQNRIHFFEGDLMEPFIHPHSADLVYASDLLQKKPYFSFDIIISNPPYVPARLAGELLKDGRNEPLLALDGGEDGLDFIRRLIPQAFGLLVPGGILFLETGEYNAEMTRTLLSECGFTDIITYTDLEGSERVTKGTKP